jgi:hypothetical protein
MSMKAISQLYFKAAEKTNPPEQRQIPEVLNNIAS